MSSFSRHVYACAVAGTAVFGPITLSGLGAQAIALHFGLPSWATLSFAFFGAMLAGWSMGLVRSATIHECKKRYTRKFARPNAWPTIKRQG